MTAEPTTPAPWAPDPIKQRAGDYLIEDVLSLPEDAPRVELRDGVMIVTPSPTVGHQKIGTRLCFWLERTAPTGFEAVAAVGVALGFRDTLEPDVLVIRQPVDNDRHYVLPEQVAVVVEIVSKSTKRRDRLERPAEYAAAGIQHFWRIEQNPLHVFAYDLIDGKYELAADAGVEDELVLSAPFEIRLPIRDIAP